MKILCVCLDGKNRSRYLAEYLKEKGHSTLFGGVKEGAVKPLLQEDINNVNLIIVVREYIKKMLEEKYNTQNKRIITLEVPDVTREYDDKAIEVFEKYGEERFQIEYVRPNIRKQIEKHLPLNKGPI